MRHLQRYREIAVAFSRNGFGYIVKGLGLDQLFTLPRRVFVNRDQNEQQGKTTGQRIRSFLEELGPTFVKMGQMLSTRPDIIPKDIVEELEFLQDQLHPIPFNEVEAVLQRELEEPVKKIFMEIDPEPIGVASIGQVHQAVLQSGERVAIKVQRPDIEKNIHTDLEILHELAERAEKRLAWASRYQLIDMVEEFSKSIKAELDFVSDGRNADLMGQQFKDNSNIIIPKVYWQFTTEKVLTMEYIEGSKMNNVEHLKKEGYHPEQLAEHLVEAVFHQIFKDGFFHADPHSGNLTALPGNRIGFFDFGMVGRLSPEMKKHLASLVIALIKQDSDDMIRAIKKMGAVPEQVNSHELKGDIEQFNIKYYGVPLSEISLGESVTDLLTVANKHKIRIPTDLTMIGKTLLSLEGILEQLDPELSIMDAAEPFGKELLKERYHPKQIAEEIIDQMQEYGEVVHDMPQIVQELANIVKQRKMPIEISVPEAKSFFSKLDRVSNRLSFSIVLLSFSLIMVGLIIGSALGRKTSLLWDIPAIEIGFVIAMLMFAWLIYSIFRSGRF
ncbi:ABC1 kinase family protein [Gracilibacillus salinarum]|uniref:AarF/ABC1/UbiB kinase family protein n=1 Tax=Gracilibacillus salinarum TaxID=2932255 RepID=A0ABY4GGB0_9BACI|nr:AarF/ABC1/UbiB kinase family protein [Gracilibacillus salinarum]UOQ83350.1 AarF/ABC1/UbiB kinase family protein [Gracilibacillus salinarum]